MEKHTFGTVAIVGLGYIGLPTAAVFASRKLKVLGVDVNQKVVETINRGDIHIIEPDLDIVVRAVVSDGYLRASTTTEPADAFIIAVPTPFKGDNHEPDLSYIDAAARAIAPVLAAGNLVILESTSPVGATEQVAALLAEARPDLTFPQTHGSESDIRVAHCPERVLPGQVMKELILNDRIIGGMSPKCSERATALYKTFVQGECIATDVRSAEMSKITENSFRDVNIAFANELSLICDRMGMDVWEVIRLANRHPRVSILNPGPGVGGHCIAVDPWFIVAASPEEAKLIRTAREVNDGKPHWVLEKVEQTIAAYLAQHPNKTREQVTIACYGLAFKPDIDDLRESPALAITRQLAARHPGKVLAVEPNLDALPNWLEGLSFATLHEAQQLADVNVYLVAHKPFKGLTTAGKFYVDTIGLFSGKGTGKV